MIKRSAWRFGALFVAAGVSACGGSDGGNTTGPEASQPASISVDPGSISMTFIGQSRGVSARILDQNGGAFEGTLTWSSSDSQVASVSSTGVVTAVDNGSAVITATFQNLSATVDVTVQQEPASLAFVSGDGQSANAGQALAELVVVRLTDVGGSPIEGTEVTFTPGENSGAVDPATSVTDAEGHASTLWTLDATLGPQTLTASVGSISATAGATALSPIPVPDLVTGGTLVLSRTDPTTLETLDVQATVRNDGNDGTDQGVRLRLLADGTEIATRELSAMEAGASETVVFTVGPLDPGQRVLTLQLDPDDAIDEADETNNEVTRQVSVKTQTALTGETTLTGLGAATDVELLFRLEIPGANNLTIDLTGGTGDVDLFVEGGERPTNRDGYDDCQSGSPTTTERCQVSPAGEGVYHILLHAFSTFSGTTMTITLDGEVLPYDIEVSIIDHGTSTQDAAFLAAAERWMKVITTDVPDSDFSVQPLEADACTTGQPRLDGPVDDIIIYVRIVDIDGPGSTLARAGPCVNRGLSNLPIVGTMEFDQADLDQLESDGGMMAVVLHEMGHVLGIGTIWQAKDLLVNPSVPSSAGVDTHFSGEHAIEAFDDVGGTGYDGGSKVPVENTAEEGSADAHWRESVMSRELMTPFLNSFDPNPLSVVSIESLRDLGYVVDPGQADSYSLSPSPVADRPAAAAPAVDLAGDLRSGPVWVLGDKGELVRVR